MTRSLLRAEQPESTYVQEAKQIAREAGLSGDNGVINWTMRMLEERLAFGNRKRN